MKNDREHICRAIVSLAEQLKDQVNNHLTKATWNEEKKRIVNAPFATDEEIRLAVKSFEAGVEAVLNGDFSHTIKACYNPEFGDYRKCKCGHSYYRHFDPYEQYRHVGCKHCECFDFEEATET